MTTWHELYLKVLWFQARENGEDEETTEDSEDQSDMSDDNDDDDDDAPLQCAQSWTMLTLFQPGGQIMPKIKEV